MLPVRTLFAVLPVPAILASPVRTRFSTLAASVYATDVLRDIRGRAGILDDHVLRGGHDVGIVVCAHGQRVEIRGRRHRLETAQRDEAAPIQGVVARPAVQPVIPSAPSIESFPPETQQAVVAPDALQPVVPRRAIKGIVARGAPQVIGQRAPVQGAREVVVRGAVVLSP